MHREFTASVRVFEDDDLLVVNKPPGLLTVPGKTPDLADCLLLRLVQEDASIRLIHRLDRDTSGLVVFAKNPTAQRHVSRQFELRQTSKVYTALVHGSLVGSGEINIPVRYEPLTPPLHVVDPAHPKHALTQWQATEVLAAITRVSLTPITGRSHQLRVHLLHIGHPIVGDTLYATQHGFSLPQAQRLCLHATQLCISHPATGQLLRLQAPVPF